jgi:hypothetical protein
MGACNINKILAKAKAKFDQINDQLLLADETSQLVRLHFSPIWVDSSACQFEDWGDSTLEARPDISANSDCQKQQDYTANIRMCVHTTTPASFRQYVYTKLGTSINFENNDILTIGNISDAAKVLNSIKADFFIKTEASTGLKTYSLSSEVRPYGLSEDKYFFCFWKKV